MRTRPVSNLVSLMVLAVGLALLLGRPATPQGDPEEEGLLWERVPVHHVSVPRLVRAFGGTMLPASAFGEFPDVQGTGVGFRFASKDPDFAPLGTAAGGEFSNLLPEGITGLCGLAGGNALLVRGTREDVDTLKRILRLLDVPQEPLLVRVTAGPLATEGRTLSNGFVRLVDATGPDRLDLTVVPSSVPGNPRRIDTVVRGEIRLNGRTLPVEVATALEPGSVAPVLVAGTGSRKVSVQVRVSRIPASNGS